MADSISWRRFARIGIGRHGAAPDHPMKMIARCGSEVIAQFNEALLTKAAQGKLLRVEKSAPTPPRVDPTLTTRSIWMC